MSSTLLLALPLSPTTFSPGFYYNTDYSEVTVINTGTVLVVNPAFSLSGK